MERITMNTQSLQDKFPEVYRDFYARNDLVVSWCFILPWVREAWTYSKSFFRFKTSLPLKCYVWINKRNDKNIVFSWVNFFDISNKKFEKIDYLKVNKEEEKIIDILKKELLKLGFTSWLDIEILSETARWHWLWFSGVSSALLSYWIYFLSKESLQEDLLNTYFKEIFSFSWKLDFISRYWDTYGHNSIFTLIPNSGISCFITDKIDINLENIDEICNIYYEFKKINIDKNIELPFDYFLVFSWMPSDTKQVEFYKKIEHSDNFISKFVEENISNNKKDIYLNKFSDVDFVSDLKFNMINLQNLNALYLLSEIYKKPHDYKLVDEFIKQINACRESVNFLENESNFAQDFLHLFKNNKVNQDEDIWVCQVYSGKLWWWYMVVTKHWLSRNTIYKTVEWLKRYYPNVELEYNSYIDWTCDDPVTVEQFISEWIYSKYIDKNKVVYKDNKWKNYLWDYSDIILNEKDWLIFDMISNKIFFNWEKLTSKDIPSQNTTIEVINRLLENINEEISNKDLPISSYTWSKNEMLWKIILPLLKFIEIKTWEKLQIVCKWSITDFFIKMWDVNLKIWTIKKI